VRELLGLLSRRIKVGDAVAPKAHSRWPETWAEVARVLDDGRLELQCGRKSEWNGAVVPASEWRLLPGNVGRRLRRARGLDED
jgi:hypothetical protein